MKKYIVPFALLAIPFSSLAQDDNNQHKSQSKDWFIGIEAFNSSNEFTAELLGYEENADVDSGGFALSFGYKHAGNKTLTTYFEYRNENFDEGVYDDLNNSLGYFSGGMMKEFPVNEKFMPYIRGSVGFGVMEIDESLYEDNTANAFGIKVGAGLSYYPTKQLKVYGGLDLQARVWSSVRTAYGDIDISDSSAILGAGVNYFF